MNRWVLCVAMAVVLPARAQPSKEAVQAAAQYSRTQSELGLVIMQDGKSLLREFAKGHPESEPLRIYSGTKFFWNLAALVAERDGLLKLDDRVAHTITEWKKSDAKSRITIRQLLNFTSGMQPLDELHEDGIFNRNTIAISRDLATEPGSRFIYGPASLQVFHELLKRKLAAKKDNPTAFLERRVLKPLGLGPQRYVADKSGNPLLAAGFMLSADQWLSIGRLILREGKPVVSSASFQQCLAGTNANPAFGLGLWTNHRAKDAGARELDVQKLLEAKWPKQEWGDGCLCRQAPSDLIASIGSHGNRVYIVPSMKLIVLRQGGRASFNDAAFLQLLFATK
jgi:CubicO group peptidase (beta-lactamase class C family)